MGMEERRRHPRVVVEIPVRLRVEGVAHEARLRDICREAALVEAERAWPLETVVELHMELPGTGGAIDVSGRVIRLAAGESGRHGMAVLFTDVAATAGMRIDFFVSLQTDLNGAS